jgi:signal transduction histidine kinase
MLHSLRTRLALSHMLPVLVLVPLLSVILLYQLERRYFLENLAQELAVQADLIAVFTGRDSFLWQDPLMAASLVRTLSVAAPLNIALINSESRLLATNMGSQDVRIGERVNDAIVLHALDGQRAWTINYRAEQTGRAIDVAVPVYRSSRWVIGVRWIVGVVRLSYALPDIQQRINDLRGLVLPAIFVGALIAVMVGLLLAQSLAKPLLALTRTISGFSPGKPPSPIDVAGPMEIQTLSMTFYRLAQRLHELEQTRSLLLSGVVHEVARPLGAIKLGAQTIMGANDLALAHSLAQGIDERVDALLPHLDDLALLGEIEVQGLRLQLEPVDVASVIHAQCELVANLAANKGLTLHCEIDERLPVIQADARRLGQIVGNLLHNAVKYTPAGGEIRVTGEVESSGGRPNQLCIQVADSGPGVAPAERERIFQFFYRNSSQRRIHQGMGLGLALARQLAEAHGGSLTVEDAPEGGALFVLCLPISPTNSAQFSASVGSLRSP